MNSSRVKFLALAILAAGLIQLIADTTALGDAVIVCDKLEKGDYAVDISKVTSQPLLGKLQSLPGAGNKKQITVGTNAFSSFDGLYNYLNSPDRKKPVDYVVLISSGNEQKPYSGNITFTDKTSPGALHLVGVDGKVKVRELTLSEQDNIPVITGTITVERTTLKCRQLTIGDGKGGKVLLLEGALVQIKGSVTILRGALIGLPD